MLFRSLLKKGADINATGGCDGTALVWASREGHVQIVQLLLEEGADINAVTRYGGTALMFATRNGYEQIIRLLLEKGADINVAGRYGHTALVKALLGDHNKQVVRLLLEYDAQPRDHWERQSIRNYGLKIYDRPGPAFTHVKNNSLHPIHYIFPLFSIFCNISKQLHILTFFRSRCSNIIYS